MVHSIRGPTRDLPAIVRDTLGFTDLAVAFQPLVDLGTGKLFAYEALVRAKHERLKNPIELFDEAIRLQCVGELGRLIREIAVARCPDHALFLNVHPRELDQGWLTRPDDPMFAHEHPVFLEITESVPMSHETYCRGTLAEVRSRGVRLVVDDLGAGYSNLRYIADLEPEVVKLDRALIANLAHSERVFRLVRAITRLCVDLDARVVAEGIERPDELEAARAAGVHFGQGYLIARPDVTPPKPQISFAQYALAT